MARLLDQAVPARTYLRRGVRWLRGRLSRRDDSEHEQAMVRIVIVGAVLAYTLIKLQAGVTSGVGWLTPTGLATFFFTTSLLHFSVIVIDPAMRPARRFVGMIMDHSAVIAFMSLGGALNAVLYPLLLWITLGYGFRYGRRELLLATLISLVMFPSLLWFNPFWQELGAFGYGLWAGLLIVPVYCLRLLTYLHDARSRAEASNLAKSRFIAAMSHELRTPLNAIIGMTDLLRGTRLAPDQRDMARTIHAAAHGLLNTIEDVLDIAKIEANALQVRLEPFSVDKVFLEIRDLLQHDARRRGLRLDLRLGTNLPLRAHGPKRAIHQVIMNLVGNALKFTETGGVRIEAWLATSPDGPPQLAIKVIDTGPGIAPENHGRVFETFAQLDQGTKRRYAGTGLGLSIVSRLLEQLQGSVRLESALGKGATFDVRVPIEPIEQTLPEPRGTVVVQGVRGDWRESLLGLASARLRVVDAADPDVPLAGTSNCVDVAMLPVSAFLHRHGSDLIVVGAGPAPPEALAHLQGSPQEEVLLRAMAMALLSNDDELELIDDQRVMPQGPTLDVLVADDNTVNRQVIRRILERAGHVVVIAENGREALDRIYERDIDAAVIDLNMPDLSGLDVASEVGKRSQRPKLIALTADATVEARDMCLAAGFDEFLTKPVDSTRLLGSLHGSAVTDTAKGEKDITQQDQAAPVPTRPDLHVVGGGPKDAPAETPSAVPVLDQKRLKMLTDLDNDDDFAVGVIDEFLADGRSLIVDLAEAATSSDLERFRDTAHALRSSAAHLGATALFQSCLGVRDLTVENLDEHGERIVADIRAQFHEAEAALLRARGRLRVA